MEIQLVIAFTVFFFALGACVGSFLNVVIWRLPYRGREVIFQQKRGPMTLSWPPSHCPVCDAGIKWYQNIPIVSWLALRAKCANCGTHIPVRYPLVELGTAVLFAGFFLAYFVGQWQPGFTDIRDWHQAAAFGLHLVFIAALLAASAIDADLYIIPLSIPWFLVIVGIAGAIGINHRAIWSLDIPNAWWMAKPIAGGAAGLAIANILLLTKILPRSFSPEVMELERLKAQTAAGKKKREDDSRKNAGNDDEEDDDTMAPPPKLTRFGPSAIATIILVLVSAASFAILAPRNAALISVIAAIFIFLIGVLPRDAGQTDVTDEVLEEISFPYVRREVLKEIPFLLVPVVCAVIAYWLPFNLPQSPWLARLLGSLFGMLVGGGIVWLVRVGGTLGFNKEAMGMGDAHLMAGVGAIVGAPLVIVAFLTAPFIGILWAIVLKIMGRPNVLPYGPWLSVASILSLLLGNPLLAWYVQILFPPLG